MVKVVNKPFEGMTRAGVEEIRRLAEESKGETKSAIEREMKSHEDGLVDIYHTSERVLEITWDRTSVERKHRREEATIVSLLVPTMISALLGVTVVAFIDRYLSPNSEYSDFWIVGLFLATVLLMIAFCFKDWTKILAEYLRDRRFGHISHFVRRYSQWFMRRAWAISDRALYVMEEDENLNGTATITRVPFEQIQTCAFKVVNGVESVSLYSKSGEYFHLPMPEGNSISGSTALTDKLRSLAAKHSVA